MGSVVKLTPAEVKVLLVLTTTVAVFVLIALLHYLASLSEEAQPEELLNRINLDVAIVRNSSETLLRLRNIGNVVVEVYVTCGKKVTKTLLLPVGETVYTPVNNCNFIIIQACYMSACRGYMLRVAKK